MAHFLLDTNHASPLVTSSHPLRARVLRCLKNGDVFALSVPVLTETLFGLRLLPRAEQNEKEWGAYVPDLPGCVTTGDTLEEAQRYIRDAIQLHLQGLKPD